MARTGRFATAEPGDGVDADFGGVAATHVDQEPAPVQLAPPGWWAAFDGSAELVSAEPADLRAGAAERLLDLDFDF